MGANAEQMEMENYVGKTIDDAVKLAGYKNLKVITETEPSYEKKDTVIRQDPEKGEKIEGGSTITLYVSDGTIPDGKVDFSISFPSEASGRFCIDFIIDEKNKTKTDSSGTIICPQMSSFSKTISGSGKDVNVTAILTNMNTSKSYTFGSYTFNFANGNYTTNSEDIHAAFEAVGGFPQPETEAPTEPPTQYVEPTHEQHTQPTTQDHPERQPGVNGTYIDGNWVDYKQGENGEWGPDDNGQWVWKWY
jgi:serine/threonine-protein kinase